jgi:hypothetical protein
MKSPLLLCADSSPRFDEPSTYTTRRMARPNGLSRNWPLGVLVGSPRLHSWRSLRPVSAAVRTQMPASVAVKNVSLPGKDAGTEKGERIPGSAAHACNSKGAVYMGWCILLSMRLSRVPMWACSCAVYCTLHGAFPRLFRRIRRFCIFALAVALPRLDELSILHWQSSTIPWEIRACQNVNNKSQLRYLCTQ